ncbi:Kazal-type serine protease inhibitor family protein, partial [Salmonella sp. s51090]|uniref:Kazal-type serine protease inhibitor family protein n=1 Tax=Salmonella sp. s51090 TaxID=3159651 RepID=UPI003980600C
MCERRLRCSNRSHDGPVICGSNNVTYSNFCEFKIAKCVDIFLTVAKEGECTEDQGDPSEYCVKCPLVPDHRGKPRRDEDSPREPLVESETETGPEGEITKNRPTKEEIEGF